MPKPILPSRRMGRRRAPVEFSSVIDTKNWPNADELLENVQGMFTVDHPIMQRMVVFFLYVEGVRPTHIEQRLKVVFGEAALSRCCIAGWCNRFANGERSLLDKARSGRPRIEDKDSGLAERFDKFIETQAGVIPTSKQVSQALNINKSYAIRLLHKRFGSAYVETHKTHKKVKTNPDVSPPSTSQQQLASSQKRVKQKRDKSSELECQLCQVTFADKDLLKAHVIQVHIGEQNMRLTETPAKITRLDGGNSKDNLHPNTNGNAAIFGSQCSTAAVNNSDNYL